MHIQDKEKANGGNIHYIHQEKIIFNNRKGLSCIGVD